MALVMYIETYLIKIMKKILVIEDENLQLEIICDQLQLEFAQAEIDKSSVLPINNTQLESKKYDVIVTDLIFNGINNAKNVQQLAQSLPNAKVFVYTMAPDSFPNDMITPNMQIVDKFEPIDTALISPIAKLFS